MCGRFEIHSTIEIIAKYFQIDSVSAVVGPNYNIAPGQDAPIVVNNGKKNLLRASHWGFVPAWACEPLWGYSLINARAETVAVNRAFRDAFLATRCIVPADGFFHWKTEGKTKRPFYIRLKSGQPLGMAGLYSKRRSGAGEEGCTFTIITTDANDLLAPVHPRMPAILPADRYATWLSPDTRDQESLRALLAPHPSADMEYYPVTPKVNSFKFNDPENIRPLAGARPAGGDGPGPRH